MNSHQKLAAMGLTAGPKGKKHGLEVGVAGYDGGYLVEKGDQWEVWLKTTPQFGEGERGGKIRGMNDDYEEGYHFDVGTAKLWKTVGADGGGMVDLPDGSNEAGLTDEGADSLQGTEFEGWHAAHVDQ